MKLMPLARIEMIFAAISSQPVLTATALRLEGLESLMCRNGMASTMMVKCASPQSNTSAKDERWSKGV
jgi:hypothetical protein